MTEKIPLLCCFCISLAVMPAEETQIVLLDGDLSASHFEFTRGTMLVEHEWRWCVTCVLGGNLADDSLGHVHQSSHLYFGSRLLTAMDELPEAWHLARNSPYGQSVKG